MVHLSAVPCPGIAFVVMRQPPPCAGDGINDDVSTYAHLPCNSSSKTPLLIPSGRWEELGGLTSTGKKVYT